MQFENAIVINGWLIGRNLIVARTKTALSTLTEFASRFVATLLAVASLLLLTIASALLAATVSTLLPIAAALPVSSLLAVTACLRPSWRSAAEISLASLRHVVHVAVIAASTTATATATKRAALF